MQKFTQLDRLSSGLDTFCNPTYIYYCEDFEEDNMAYKQNGDH